MVKKTSALLIFLVVVALLSSLSHALILDGLLINALQATGVLRCSLNGNLNAPPLSGIMVRLHCDGTDLAQAVTDQSGAFTVMTGSVLGLTNLNLQRCLIRANLPVASCSVLPTSGVLTGPLSLLRVIQSTVGNVACLVLTGPIRIE